MADIQVVQTGGAATTISCRVIMFNSTNGLSRVTVLDRFGAAVPGGMRSFEGCPHDAVIDVPGIAAGQLPIRVLLEECQANEPTVFGPFLDPLSNAPARRPMSGKCGKDGT